MKNATLTQVKIDQIDFSDRTYIFTFEPLMSQMVQSIRNIGLLNPPILAQISDKPSYRIVSGLKRILALIHLKTEIFSAFIFQDKLEKINLYLFLKNFYDNISIRVLNPIEKSHVLNKLINTCNVSSDEILTTYLPLIGLGSNPKILDSYLPLIQLEDNLKIAVVENFFSPDFAVRLLNYCHQDRQAIYDLFSTLKLGKNRQKEFLRLLDDISNIIDKPIAEIVNQSLIQSTLSDEKLTVSLKVNRIRDIFRKMRFPIFSQAEDNFNSLKKELKLPPQIVFRPSPFFENDKYSIEISFKNQTEFDDALKILTNITENKKLNKLELLMTSLI